MYRLIKRTGIIFFSILFMSLIVVIDPGKVMARFIEVPIFQFILASLIIGLVYPYLMRKTTGI